MKMRTASMIGASFAYLLLLLPLTRVRAQARPAVPEPASVPVPALPAVPAMPALPAMAGTPPIPAVASVPAFLSGTGPHGERSAWAVDLLVRTRGAADSEVTTQNGPVSFYTVDGKITTRATNGPITLKDCSGEADISAQNGPISFSGTSGKLRLHTQNGPISVSLGANWDGSELVADAVNGPLTLRVPTGFRSSFLVESNGHSPISCHASICSDARKTWDDEHRRIEYGSGSPVHAR